VGGREHSGIRRRSGARSPFLGNRPAAMSVATLPTMPRAEGLFHDAIV
jgi:hypothetical protein